MAQFPAQRVGVGARFEFELRVAQHGFECADPAQRSVACVDQRQRQQALAGLAQTR
jgi:hypothetical protein